MQYAARGDGAISSEQRSSEAHTGGEATRDRNEAQASAALRSRGGGQPLAAPVRGKMEHAFGADFGAVRVHEDGEAGALGAKAYAAGTDIHMAPGEYAPDSEHGQELIGHELAHVIQQSQGRVAGGPQAKGGGINQDASLEREADEMGAKAARGQRVGSFGAIAAKQGGPRQLKTINKVTGGTVDTANKKAFAAYVKTLSPSQLTALEGQLADEPAAKSVVTAAILAQFDEPAETPKPSGGAQRGGGGGGKAAAKPPAKALNKNTLREEVVDLKVTDLDDADLCKAAFSPEEQHTYTSYVADRDLLLAQAAKPIADLNAYDVAIKTKLRDKNAEVKRLIKRYNTLKSDPVKVRLIKAYGPSASAHFGTEIPRAHVVLADTFGRVEYASQIPLEHVVAASKTLPASEGFAAFAVRHRAKAFELLLAAKGAPLNVVAAERQIEADQRKQRFAEIYGAEADASGPGPGELEKLIDRVDPIVAKESIAGAVPVAQLAKVNRIIAATVGFDSFLATYRAAALREVAAHVEGGDPFSLATAREHLQGAVGITNVREDRVGPGSRAFAQGARGQFDAFDGNNKKLSLTSAQKLAVMDKKSTEELRGAEHDQYGALKPDSEGLGEAADRRMKVQLDKEQRKLPKKVKGAMELTLQSGATLKSDLQIFLSGGKGSSEYSYGPGLARQTGAGSGDLAHQTYPVKGQKQKDYPPGEHQGHHEHERDIDAEVKIMERTIALLNEAQSRGQEIQGATLKIFVSRYTCPSCADMLYKAKTTHPTLMKLGSVEVIYQGKAMD